MIGTVLEFRTKAAATKAAEALRININSETPRDSLHGASFDELAEHYISRELDTNQLRHANSKTTLDVYAKAVTPPSGVHTSAS